jgi:hypothetical protein
MWLGDARLGLTEARFQISDADHTVGFDIQKFAEICCQDVIWSVATARTSTSWHNPIFSVVHVGSGNGRRVGLQFHGQNLIHHARSFRKLMFVHRRFSGMTAQSLKCLGNDEANDQKEARDRPSSICRSP